MPKIFFPFPILLAPTGFFAFMYLGLRGKDQK